MRPVANRLIGLFALSAAILGTHPACVLAQTSQESEPNNSPATADSTALGLFMSGYINVAGDTDYYFIDLVRGTDVAFWVDAARLRGPLNSMMGLLDGDGRTLLAVNDDGNDDYVTDS